LFNEELNINTTSNTKISHIPAFEDVNEDMSVLQELKLKEVQFTSVMVTKTNKCSVCKRSVDVPENAELVKCSNCNFKQLLCNLDSQVSITGFVKNQTTSKKILVQQDALTSFLHDQDKLGLLANLDALEDFLILNYPYDITFSGKGELVSSIQLIKSSAH
jgi:DNA-directed RNA polymerase subunit RPC12/RpoP